MDSYSFSALEIDAIGEILNISLGASATAVSTMLNARVDITTPVVQVLSSDEFEFSELEPAIGVEITYVSGLSGSNIMLLKRHDVKVIVEMLMGMEIPDDEFELNEINISAICEVMNQMMGASSTALSEFLDRMVNISTPTSFEIKDTGEFKRNHFANEGSMVVINFTLKISDRLESEFINVMPPELAKELVRGFLPDEYLGEEPEKETPSEPEPTFPESTGGSDRMMSQEDIEKMLAGVGADSAPSEPAASEPTGGSDRMMSQEDIEKMLAGVSGDSTPSEPAAPEPSGGSDRMMSQEDIERMLAGMDGDAGQAQPQQAPVVSQPVMQPQQTPAVTQAPPQPDPATQQLIMQMAQMQQQMQQQMMAMMNQMQQNQAQQSQVQQKHVEPKTIKTQKMVQSNLDAGQNSGEEQEENRELIMGVPLELSVEIGRTTKLVKEILEFTKGSLVILDKLAGEQVDLFVNGRCIAKGDVVVVDDNFGIRITEIIRKDVQEE